MIKIQSSEISCGCTNFTFNESDMSPLQETTKSSLEDPLRRSEFDLEPCYANASTMRFLESIEQQQQRRWDWILHESCNSFINDSSSFDNESIGEHVPMTPNNNNSLDNESHDYYNTLKRDMMWRRIYDGIKSNTQLRAENESGDNNDRVTALPPIKYVTDDFWKQRF